MVGEMMEVAEMAVEEKEEEEMVEEVKEEERVEEGKEKVGQWSMRWWGE